MHPSSSYQRATRRVRASAVACLGVVVAFIACRQTDTTAQNLPLVRFVNAPGDTLKEPLVIRSVRTPVNGGKDTIGILDVTLQVVLDSTVVPGDTTRTVVALQSYKLVKANGAAYNNIGFPGPTFRVHQGDSVRILLVNKLAKQPDSLQHQCLSYQATQRVPPVDTFPNCFHGSSWTNIHYHGMHITPQGGGDNVLIAIGPDSSWQSAFRIPPDQSPGTMWYHPHKHGSVAVQISNGMAGAFIVEGGGLDSLTQSLGMKEHLIGVQQIESTVNLMGGLNQVTLVDGQQNPVITMRPNEVQRWRLVNENVSATTTYALVFDDTAAGTPTPPKLYDIARDGVQYAPANYQTNPDTSLIVAPGNRLDMFVQAPSTPGLHRLKARPLGPILGRRARALLGASNGNQLLTVNVVNDSAKVNTVLPTALPPLPAFLANLDTVGVKDIAASVVFSETGYSQRALGTPPSFFLGTQAKPKQKFNPGGAPFITMPLNKTQTWKVINNSDSLNHPFHIHINPFQVLYVSYTKTDPNAAFYRQIDSAATINKAPLWMDTFALPVNGYIVIRQKYADFTGSFVMHCHILGHEERGMMQLVAIQ